MNPTDIPIYLTPSESHALYHLLFHSAHIAKLNNEIVSSELAGLQKKLLKNQVQHARASKVNESVESTDATMLQHIKEIKRYYLSENRGNKRVWLEGSSLTGSGFTPGSRYTRTIAPDGTIILKIQENGEFVVSKKTLKGASVPVIDMHNKNIDAYLQDSIAVEVQYNNNTIVIQKSDVDKIINEREARIINKITNNIPLDAGSLYHGGGILDSGFHEGFGQYNKSVVKLAIELEERYLQCSMANNTFWSKDAWAVTSPVELTLNKKTRDIKLDILTMGIPCTGASKSGMAKNHLALPEEHKSAGAQFYYALKWIEAAAPGIVIIENVPEYQKSAGWLTMNSVLKKLGYDIQVRIFNGVEFGAIENRNRMIAVAVSHGIQKHINLDLDMVKPRITKPLVLADILDTVPLDSPVWKSLTYLKEKEIKDIAEGKGFKLQWLNPDVATSIGTIGKGYAKLRSTEPFIIHPENPELARILTPNEHARAKTIPIELIKGIESHTTAHEILGQSVIREWFVQIGSTLSKNMLAIKTINHTQENNPKTTKEQGLELF